MGGSGNWIKSLIALKKPNTTDQEKVGGEKSSNKKKWRLWRSSSEGLATSSKGIKSHGHAVASQASDSSYGADEAFSAALAAVIRAAPKDFLVVKQEWAAVRIQTAFRGFLARRALRALRAVVRIQAIFRGRQVRKQAAVTLRCMQALVRVQARVRAHCSNISSEDEAKRTSSNSTKQAERGWCDRPGSADEVRAKLQMRQEGAIKRERAMVYSTLCQQQPRWCASPNKQGTFIRQQPEPDKASPRWNWLDRWMSVKPWDPSETPPASRKSESSVSEYDSIHVKKTTRISAKPPAGRSRSAPSSGSLRDECSGSTSSSSSLSPMTNDRNPRSVTVDRAEVSSSYYRKPSYMKPTVSIKAKHKQHCRILKKGVTSSSINGDERSSGGSEQTFDFPSELYAQAPSGRHVWIKSRRS